MLPEEAQAIMAKILIIFATLILCFGKASASVQIYQKIVQKLFLNS